jgi:hypothetical protein
MLSFYEMNRLLEKNKAEAFDPLDMGRKRSQHPDHTTTGRNTRENSELADQGRHLDRALDDKIGYHPIWKGQRGSGVAKMDDLSSVLAQGNQYLAREILNRVLPRLDPSMQYDIPTFLAVVGSKLSKTYDPAALGKALNTLVKPPEGQPPQLKVTNSPEGPKVSVIRYGNTNDQEDRKALPGEGGRYASGMSNVTRTTKVGENQPVDLDYLTALAEKHNDRLMTLFDAKSPTFTKEADDYMNLLFDLQSKPMDDETKDVLDQEIGVWDQKVKQFRKANPNTDYRPAPIKTAAVLAQEKEKADKENAIRQGKIDYTPSQASGPDSSAYDRRAVAAIKAELAKERDPAKRKELMDDLALFGGSMDDAPQAAPVAPPASALPPKPVVPTLGRASQPTPPLPPPPPTVPSAPVSRRPGTSPLSGLIRKK